MEEREVAALDDKQAIFGSLFLLATTLDTVGDRFLGDLTTKQWYLMAMLGTFFAEPPTIGELAERMGTSHQNVKQIARRLEEKGFLDLERDRPGPEGAAGTVDGTCPKLQRPLSGAGRGVSAPDLHGT